MLTRSDGKYLRAIRVLVSVVLLIVASFSTSNASANPSDTCRQVRNVRRLAIQEGLDDETLTTLEYRYCATGQQSSVTLPPPQATQDCIDLTVITRLIRMAETNADHIRLVESRQIVSCGLLEQSTNTSSDYYPNGQHAKWGSDWYYPNGQHAKWGSDWYYPNGQHAKWGSDWYYPNGQHAKWGSDWYYPNGSFASADSLLSWGCSIIKQNECAARLSEVRKSQDFWRSLAIIDLAWVAHKTSRTEKDQ